MYVVAIYDSIRNSGRHVHHSIYSSPYALTNKGGLMYVHENNIIQDGGSEHYFKLYMYMYMYPVLVDVRLTIQ